MLYSAVATLRRYILYFSEASPSSRLRSPNRLAHSLALGFSREASVFRRTTDVRVLRDGPAGVRRVVSCRRSHGCLTRTDGDVLRSPVPGTDRAASPRASAALLAKVIATYLVDPASSHMLVSKIKPCMSKYKLLHGETANGSLNQLWFIRWCYPTWITVVILELIHATKLRPSWNERFY